MLLPAYAAHGDPHHPLVAQVLCDHVAIRHRADALASDGASRVAADHELGDRLADHVRLEERQLFPLIESAMPTAQLAAVAAELGSAEHSPAD